MKLSAFFRHRIPLGERLSKKPCTPGWHQRDSTRSKHLCSVLPIWTLFVILPPAPPFAQTTLSLEAKNGCYFPNKVTRHPFVRLPSIQALVPPISVSILWQHTAQLLLNTSPSYQFPPNGENPKKLRLSDPTRAKGLWGNEGTREWHSQRLRLNVLYTKNHPNITAKVLQDIMQKF